MLGPTATALVSSAPRRPSCVPGALVKGDSPPMSCSTPICSRVPPEDIDRPWRASTVPVWTSLTLLYREPVQGRGTPPASDGSRCTQPPRRRGQPHAACRERAPPHRSTSLPRKPEPRAPLPARWRDRPAPSTSSASERPPSSCHPLCQAARSRHGATPRHLSLVGPYASWRCAENRAPAMVGKSSSLTLTPQRETES